jgi:hypothetical protein
VEEAMHMWKRLFDRAPHPVDLLTDGACHAVPAASFTLPQSPLVENSPRVRGGSRVPSRTLGAPSTLRERRALFSLAA